MYINSVYRLKESNQEFIYYHENLSSTDYLGNKTTHFRVIGKQKYPEFVTQFDEAGEQAKYIDSSEDKYSIPFNSDFVEKEIEPFLGERPNFYVIEYGKKYGGFGLQELKEYNYDDLVRLGQYGTTNPTEIKQIEKKKRLA